MGDDIFMEMTFGDAHEVWNRAVCGDKTLSSDEVKAAAQWFDEFSDKLRDKASQSQQALDDAIERHEDDAAIEKKCKAAESDKCQLEDCIRKHDDLIGWLNTHK